MKNFVDNMKPQDRRIGWRLREGRDIDAVANALDLAGKHGLQAEVVWSAMKTYAKYHKHAPETYDMGWAFECALNDWDI